MLQTTREDRCHVIESDASIEQVFHSDKMPFEHRKRHILRGVLLCYHQVGFDRIGTAGQRLACQVAQVFDRGNEFSAALSSNQMLGQVIPQVELTVRK